MAGGAIGAVFSGLSMVVGAMGTAAGDAADAQKAKRAQQIANVQADQLDASYRGDLNTTIANIKSIRASTGGDPESPTSLAYIDTQTTASDRVRRIKVGDARLQANQDGLDAATYASAAKTSLLGGVLQSIPAFIGSPGTWG